MYRFSFLLAFMIPILCVGQQWSYYGTYGGIPYPLDYIFLENLTQGGDTTIDADIDADNDWITFWVGIDDQNDMTMNGFSLLPGHPNPFGDHTVFGINTQTGGTVQVDIYDALGRNLANHTFKSLAPGIHQFQFGGSHAGVYFVSVVLDDIRQVLRLVQLENAEKVNISYLGNSSGARPKDGFRELYFSWHPFDEIRHIAYATLPCGAQAQASDTIQDYPLEHMDYYMELTQLPTAAIPCLITDRDSIQLNANCNSISTSPQSFQLGGEHLNCDSVTIGPLAGYQFSSQETGLFTNSINVEVSTPMVVWVIFDPQTAYLDSANLTIICDNAQVLIHLSGTLLDIPSVATLTGTDSICTGSSAIFESSIPGGVWSSISANVTISNQGDSTATITGAFQGQSVITYAVGQGLCLSTSTDTVTVTYPPDAGAISAQGPFYIGGTVVAYPTNGGGGIWSSSDPLVATIEASTIDDSGTITGVSEGSSTITYLISGTGGCAADSATLEITVTSSPQPTLSVTPQVINLGTVCLNSVFNIANFDISGSGLDSGVPLAIQGPSNFLFNTFLATYTNPYTISHNGALVVTPAHLRFSANTVGPINTTFSFFGGGADTVFVQVIGTVSNTPPFVSPTVISQGDDEFETMTLTASAQNNGCAPITSYGFMVSLNSDFSDSTAQFPTGDMDAYSAQVSIEPGSTYYVRAYASYAGGAFITFGEQVTYITRPGPVITNGYSIGDTLIQFGGWEPVIGATTYKMEIALDLDFQQPLPGYPLFIPALQMLMSYDFGGLEPATTYYVRAQAVNANDLNGPYYNAMPYQITTVLCPSQVFDQDGNFYGVTEISGQCWTTENLRTTVYADSTIISNYSETDSATWVNNTVGAWYNMSDANYDDTYGKLYNWYAVSNSHGLCPAGWDVPSDSEWLTLETALGMPVAELNNTSERGAGQNVGGKMKMVGNEFWQGNVGATNESNFSAKPAGRVLTIGLFGNAQPGLWGYWWSNSENVLNQNEAWYRCIYGSTQGIYRYFYGMKNWGLSVRCIKQ